MNFDYSYYFNKRASNVEFAPFDLYRISAMISQDGRCYVTERTLKEKDRELHHRTPRHYGGKDVPENLIYVCKDIHLMIHTFSYSRFCELFFMLELSQEEFDFVNQLRAEAHRLSFPYPAKNAV